MALKDIELRSEEVQDILTTVPSWMVRRGNVLFLIIILGLIGLTFIVEYPDTIDARATITTIIPAESIVPLVSGRIEKILIEDGQNVFKQQDLAYIENSANYTDVLLLKEKLGGIRFRESNLEIPSNKESILTTLTDFQYLTLGEIDIHFEAFEQAMTRYSLDLELNPYASQRRTSSLGLNEINRRKENLTSQKAIAEKELKIAETDLLRNKELLKKGVISQLEYEQKQIAKMQKERNFKNLSVSLSQLRDAAYVNQATTVDTENLRITNSKVLYSKLIRSYNQLKKAIDDWEMKYILKAGQDGQALFTDRWFGGQMVNAGQSLFRIVPNDLDSIIAEIWIPSGNSGKVELGQNVQLGLDNFPENEFGWINGKVSKIATIPNKDGQYLVIIDIPSDLKTSYDKNIPFRPEMAGNARIITRKQKLANRIFYQINEIRKNL